jgi:hypothetical protein
MTQPRWSLAGAEYGRGEGSSATDFEPRSRTLQEVSSPGLYDPGVGKQVPLKERVRLGEITDSSRAVADRGCRLDDRLEDGLTGLLTETLIGHGQRCYLPGPGERHVNANPIGPIRQAGQSIPSARRGRTGQTVATNWPNIFRHPRARTSDRVQTMRVVSHVLMRASDVRTIEPVRAGTAIPPESVLPRRPHQRCDGVSDDGRCGPISFRHAPHRLSVERSDRYCLPPRSDRTESRGTRAYVALSVEAAELTALFTPQIQVIGRRPAGVAAAPSSRSPAARSRRSRRSCRSGAGSGRALSPRSIPASSAAPAHRRTRCCGRCRFSRRALAGSQGAAGDR